MDSHVAEHAARNLEVLDGQPTIGILGDHRDHLDVADRTRSGALLHLGNAWIEAAIEGDEQRPVGTGDRRQQLLDALDVEVDRLLAEHGLTGGETLLDQFGVGAGGRADDDSGDLGIVQRRRFVDVGRADFRGEVTSRRFHRIDDVLDRGTRVGRDVAAMHVANAARAEQGDLVVGCTHDVLSEGGR